jgi:flagellar basal body-associated protein FliL
VNGICQTTDDTNTLSGLPSVMIVIIVLVVAAVLSISAFVLYKRHKKKASAKSHHSYGYDAASQPRITEVSSVDPEASPHEV